MKKACLVLLLTTFGGSLSGQNPKIDSLRKVLKVSIADTIQLQALNDLSWQLIITGNYDSAMACTAQSIAIADKSTPNARDGRLLTLKKYKAAAFNNRASVHYMRGEYQDAMRNFSESLEINTANRYKIGISRAYNGLGVVNAHLGNYPEAIKNYFSCLKIQNEIGDKKGSAALYNNIGIIFFDQKNYPEALKNYAAALKINKETGNKEGIAMAYNNLGLVHKEKLNYPEALKNYFAGLKINEEMGNKRLITASLDNIGVAYYFMGKSEEALPYHIRSLHMLEELGDKRGLSGCYINLANNYLKLNKTDEAAVYLNKGLSLAKEIGNVELMRSGYEGTALVYEQKSDFKKAYENYKQFIKHRDSLANDEYTRKTVQAQLNFEFEQQTLKTKAEQDKKDALVAEELKRENLVKWSSIGSLGLLLLTSLLFFNRLRLKQKHRHQQELNQKQKEQANAVMEIQEQERKRIAEDLHDSLGHLLSTAKLNLQTLPGGQQQVMSSLNLLNQASEEIRNITFNLMPRTLEEGGLLPALDELANKISASGSVKVNLHVHDMEKFALEKQSQFNMYRIIQEAVNNILKHAAASEINIQLIGQNDHITIMIEDDGRGFNPQTNVAGRGLKNIVTRSLWLKGNINIDSTPGRGTTITTEIPV